MIEHKGGIKEEILWMLSAMGDDANLDLCENLDDYADWLEEMTTGELYDTYSSVNSDYGKWLADSKVEKTVEHEPTRSQ